jgi:type II secretory pathway component PulF
MELSMPAFTFNARDPAGRPQNGTQEAASAAALVNTLRERGWLVLEVRPAGQEQATDLLATINPLAWLPPRSVDIEVGLQQVAVMLRSGITLLSALKTVAEQAPRISMRKIWEDVADRIQEGSSLADAMAAHSRFNHLVVQLIRVGEQTGTLEPVLTRAADALERRRHLRTSLVTAMMYPSIVLVAAVGVTVFMVVGVIPKLKVFLNTLGRKLPPMTQFLVDLSDAVEAYWIQGLSAVGGIIVAAIAIYLWPPGRLFVDRALLRVPVIGRLLRLAATVQFARGLGTLIASGITLVEGLRTVEGLFRNRYVAIQVAAARNAVLRGGSLATPLEERHVFMPMLSRMVAVGEAAGTLDDVLDEVARFHDSQLQSAIRQFSAIIEPVIVVVVGGIVGFVYVAFFMALFAAAGSAR